MNRHSFAASACIAAMFSLAVVPRSFGQAAPAPAPSPAAGITGGTTDEVVQMSPFVIEDTEGTGYRAQSTLAGTRVKTDLKDIASSVSVVTADFLRDTGATGNQTLLQYTTNTEVGGIYGNYAGIGGIYINGANESSNFLKPSTNTRVRGLDSADNTRDYFQTDIPWDVYNIGRIDLQRGPNSILFGIGSPAGIVNASVNTAEYKNQVKVENRVGSFGTVRDSLDFSRELLKDVLVVRMSALDDDTKYRQKPAFNHDKRLFGALRWDPRVFERWDSTAHTTVRANYEHGDVTANRPRVLPPEDRITPFFDSAAINKTAIDPSYASAAGVIKTPSSQEYLGESANYWLVPLNNLNLQVWNNPMFSYSNVATGAISDARQRIPSLFYGLGSNGTIDGTIDGLPSNQPQAIATYNEYTVNVNTYNPSVFPGAASGFYKARSLTDPTIFDFYNNLIDGPNKKEWNGWNAYNLSVVQTFFNNRLGINLVYDRQKYHDGQERNLNNPYISVDINANNELPWAYNTPSVIRYNGTGAAGTNAYAGSAFVGSSAANGGNGVTFSDRENIRAIITGEIHADDFMHKSWLSNLLGHHVFTGLYSHENYDLETRNWERYAIEEAWSDAIGFGANGSGSGAGYLGLTSCRVVDWTTYLSTPLFNKSSASGLYLPAIDVVQSPSGSATIRYFDSNWKWSMNPTDPRYVNPGAVWTNPTKFPGQDSASTQSENPANYVGWVNGTFKILNADQGDIDSLYTDGSKIRKQTSSTGMTWQAYFWDNTIVATAGYRRDKQEQRSGSAPTSSVTGAASMSYGLNALDPASGLSYGDSISWGVVLHTPKFLREKLPWESDIALTYSYGHNIRAESRYGFDGNVLPNAKGVTRDYGVVISTLGDRVRLKTAFYDTKVYDANISSVTTAVSTLGNATGWLSGLEAWGTAGALTDLAGMAGKASGMEGYWDWAMVDNGWDYSKYGNPASTAFLTSASTIKEKAAVNSWLSQMLPQSWFDAYGYPYNVAAAKAGDWANAISGWTPYTGIGGIKPGGGGRINGSFPTGTVDNESKGVEFELDAQLTRNWNITANASKQKAIETSLGASLSSFIEASERKYASPAGDLRLWWGGDQTLRYYYNQDIWAAYQFQKSAAGRMVSEMSPWRFNLITNYLFDHGIAKGVNVGMAYRWEQGKILGYGINAAGDNLDVNKPFWGKGEYWVDLWAGHQWKLSSKIDWRIQLNLRNVDSRPHLTPVSVQPDGGPAQFRIEEGQTWELTNTFIF